MQINGWLNAFFVYLFVLGLFEVLVHWVIKPLIYKFSGKENLDKEIKREDRINRVRTFGEMWDSGIFQEVEVIDARYFGYENSYEMWQEISDYSPSLLKYFKPSAYGSLSVVNKK